VSVHLSRPSSGWTRHGSRGPAQPTERLRAEEPLRAKVEKMNQRQPARIRAEMAHEEKSAEAGARAATL